VRSTAAFVISVADRISPPAAGPPCRNQGLGPAVHRRRHCTTVSRARRSRGALILSSVWILLCSEAFSHVPKAKALGLAPVGLTGRISEALPRCKQPERTTRRPEKPGPPGPSEDVQPHKARIRALGHSHPPVLPAYLAQHGYVAPDALPCAPPAANRHDGRRIHARQRFVPWPEAVLL
jgi:hypothetical protein